MPRLHCSCWRTSTALNLSEWALQALARWRQVTHRLWTDLVALVGLNVQFDPAELDALTLSVLCHLAAFGALLRNQRAPLQQDVMAAFQWPLWPRVLLFSVIGVTAATFFAVFVGLNVAAYYDIYLLPTLGVPISPR